MSRIFDCSQDDKRELGVRTAAAEVAEGKLVVLPTDTLYGLGCDAFNNQAVNQLLATKRRGPDMPVPVLIGSWDTVRGLVHTYTPNAQRLVEAFWPGGLSIVIEQAPSLMWNLGDTRGTVMLRMPLHPVAIELLRATGPMAVSSANISGQPPATTVVDAKQQLGNAVSTYLNGGECAMGQPSSIVDLSGNKTRLLREGAISAERIAEVLEIDPEQLRAR
ncbi:MULTISPECIES: L-threonylcarbamoyladenylate synthase [unclassified Corynebacterium]|uniref:L-threonylcarbamoyladenylate synthase n=1 Tax=unclassified Corynebacterium TaxID=2624378 RepID=UPI001C462721|nr:threonylcarbamoyl-AMP synthase [Corynebacterium sp. TAE3-ERU30]MBV7301155.1 threonylcarbamoyl-AMP synthase [Corynebacterium sp. TAE3-ERU2]